MLIEHLGGAVSRASAGETAFPHRSAHYNFLTVSRWTDAMESDTHVQWARELWTAMQPLSSGIYVNYMGAEGEDLVRAAYGASYERLVALKNKYDPTNFFRQNHNVKPTASAAPSYAGAGGAEVSPAYEAH